MKISIFLWHVAMLIKIPLISFSLGTAMMKFEVMNCELSSTAKSLSVNELEISNENKCPNKVLGLNINFVTNYSQ